MERLFIETKYEGEVRIPAEVIEKLPSTLVLALPVQFLDQQQQIQEQLEQAGKKVILFQSKHGKYPGQVLGCDIFEFKADFEAFFYLGDGRFHPTALLYENKQSIYCYNPFNEALAILEPKDLDKLKQKRKGQLAKFLNSKVIGILVTTKPGQRRDVEDLRVKLEQEGKEVFVFLDNEVNFSKLEDFNFIESWINTACPRIVEDFNCLNVDDLKEVGF